VWVRRGRPVFPIHGKNVLGDFSLPPSWLSDKLARPPHPHPNPSPARFSFYPFFELGGFFIGGLLFIWGWWPAVSSGLCWGKKKAGSLRPADLSGFRFVD